MATKKKKINTEVQKIECTYSIGGACAMQAAACNVLESSLQKTKWKHRENYDREYRIEALYVDQNEMGNFTFFIILSSEGEVFAAITFYEFLHSFEPCGEMEFENGVH